MVLGEISPTDSADRRGRYRDAHFSTVIEAVVVRVWIQHIDEAITVAVRSKVWLFTIDYSVVVGILVARVGAKREFFSIGQAIAIGINQNIISSIIRIGFTGIDLTVVIHVFSAITNAAAISIWINHRRLGRWVGVWHKEALRWVGAVGRGTHRCRDPGFGAIKDAVVVRVWVEHIDRAVAVVVG